MTGCEVNYDLNVENDFCTEKTTMSVSSYDEYNLYAKYISPTYEYYARRDISIYKDNSSNSLYKKDFNYKKNPGFSFALSGKFDKKSSFEKSSALAFAGNIDSQHKNNNNTVNYSFSPDFFDKYYMIEKLYVNITDKSNSIISANADKKEDGKYVWIITGDNYLDKKITFTYKDKTISLKKIINDTTKKTNDPMVKFAIILIIIFSVMFLIYKFVIFRYKKNNSL